MKYNATKVVHDHESQNRWRGRQNMYPETIVIHSTGSDFHSAHNTILNPGSDVSYHYIVDRDGHVHRYVHPDHAAWHAGEIIEPEWGRLIESANPNNYTIGVAFVSEYPQNMNFLQAIAGGRLLADLCNYYQIKPADPFIICHDQINKGKQVPCDTIRMTALIRFAWLFTKLYR